MAKNLNTPLTDDALADLQTGDEVLITGVIYTARDAAHRRIIEAVERGEQPPIDLQGQIIYYVGPTPPRDQATSLAPPGQPRPIAWTHSRRRCSTWA